MTTVLISLSQSAATTMNALKVQNKEITLAQIFDTSLGALIKFDQAHGGAITKTQNGSTISFGFSDGSTVVFGGVVLADPNAPNGTGTATSVTVVYPDNFQFSYAGEIKVNYSSNSPTDFSPDGGVITDSSIRTLYSTNSSAFNQILGNVNRSFKGLIDDPSSNNFSGVITQIISNPDKFISSDIIAGRFNISGNNDNIANNIASTAVSGNLTSRSMQFNDGSYVNISDGSIAVNGSSTLDDSIYSEASNFPNNDVFDINLPATNYGLLLVASGAGDDQVTLNGGGALLSANLGDGHDNVILKDAGHTVIGGAGLDTATFTGNRSIYSIEKGPLATTDIRFSTGGIDTLAEIERLKFSDMTVALDINGTAGQAYRIYQAAFNRTPDNDGLKYWIGLMDGGVSLPTISSAFIVSAEFKALYGPNPTNELFVSKLYDNVLHRAPDQGGYDYWVGLLKTNKIDSISTLINFSESAENQAGVIGVIQNGIDLLN